VSRLATVRNLRGNMGVGQSTYLRKFRRVVSVASRIEPHRTVQRGISPNRLSSSRNEREIAASGSEDHRMLALATSLNHPAVPEQNQSHFVLLFHNAAGSEARRLRDNPIRTCQRPPLTSFLHRACSLGCDEFTFGQNCRAIPPLHHPLFGRPASFGPAPLRQG
jgi:hypothetical protein